MTTTRTGQAHDLTEIRRALTVLYQPGDVVELRALDVGGKTVAGYFDDHAKLAESAAKLSGQAAGVYIVLNQLTPALLARSANRLTTGPKNLTQDKDISRRRYLAIDIDANRPSGISATDAEHEAAIEAALKIKEYLVGLGFPADAIIIGDSGNGGHLLVRVDLPNDANSTNLIKTCLEALATRFDDAAVSIDPGVFNAARIWKLPGTLARKGDSTPARPHRLARLLDVPATLAIAPIDALMALAATLPAKETPPTRPYHRPAQPFDLEAWMSAHGIEVKSSGPYRGGTRYILKQCAFNGDHTGTSAAIFQDAAGRIGYKCQHAECVGKTWADVRELKEPGYKDRLAAEGLHITIDGVTYLERLDLNRIICKIPPAREDAPPVVKTLASFIIEPRMRITLDGESERLATLLKTSEAEYPNLFKREAWNSKRQFLAALPSVDLQYYGTDKDTQAILAMVTSKELPIRRGATVLGRNGDLWVISDGVLSKDGWLENPELVYIPSEVEFDRRVRYPTPEDETGLIKRVIPQLLMLNEGKIIFPVLGWFFATPFVPEIRRRLHHFPLLVVWGTHGGGKSSLLSLLWELFGVKSELFSATETPFTFLRLFSGTSTIPILIDEFKPFTMKEDETRLLIRFLKRLYDGEIEHRGRPDLSLVAYHLQAPTAIAGEVTPISLESAMVERVIQVNLNPDTLSTHSEYVSAFNELATLALGGFAFPYIRWCLSASLDDLMDEARTLLPTVLRDVPPRVRDNALVMTTGLVALKRFAAGYGVEIAQEAFRNGITESITELLNELFERGAYQEIGLTIFLETLATLAQTKRITHGVHYTTDGVNTRLYIHLPDCLPEFRKFVRETSARVEVLDERAYRRQAREVCERKGYVLNTFTNKWFKMYQDEKGEKGKIRSCMEIDMEQLPFDTSGFEEPVGD
jgi:hypothetical protein